ncbi:MAG TPA: mechanosensitive ion channel domain-containing protein [Usitatibacter sp.]|nr:mechanosensitive ion channel domain-containing protein [Usitatibacter sp.]
MLRRVLASWAGASLLACAAAAWAQAPQPAAPASPASFPEGRPATLVVMNRPVLTFRGTYLGYSPADRAQQSQARIESLLQRGGPGKVGTEATPQGVAVKVDDALAFLVTPADADVPKALGLEATAQAAAERLAHAITETSEVRDVRAMLLAGAYAAAGLVIYLVLLWALVRARRVAFVGIASRAARHAKHFAVAGVRLVEGERFVGLLRAAISLLYWLLALLLTYEWAGRTLQLFPYTRPWGERLTGFLIATVEDLATAIARAIPDLLVAALIFVIAWFVAGGVKGFFGRVERGHVEAGWLDADTARPTRRLAVIGIWLLALVMAYPYLPGASTDAFKGISVLVGLMVSLGGANVVGQALSGLIIMYTRTFRVGEFVRIGEHEGTVTEIGMYQTRLRTGLAEEVVLPNATILSSVTRNFSRDTPSGFVIHATATIGYDAPWRQVHAMLQEAARRTPGVLPEPAPRVLQMALSDFYVDYRLVVHARPQGAQPRAELISRLHENIQDVFNEHGVQIMSPHYFADPEQAKLVPRARWFTPPAEAPGKS